MSTHHNNVFTLNSGGWTRISNLPASIGTVNYSSYQNFYTGDSINVGLNKFAPFIFTIAKFIFFANPNYTQTAIFYKSITKNNIYQWFIYSGFENEATKICTDYNLTQNCSTKGFDHDYYNDGISITDGYISMFWGTGLEKYGFLKVNIQPFHTFAIDGTGWCSTTGNLNNNAWTDLGGDGHWGNGLIIYLK